MQWSAERHAGFTSGDSWLPVADDFVTVNVAAQTNDPHSLLTLYRRLITLRASEPALYRGTYAPVGTDEQVLAYSRTANGKQFLIVLNFCAAPVTFTHAQLHGRLDLSTELDREGEKVVDALPLRGNEGVIVQIS
jgi:alpha-glucosidase